MQFMIDEGRWIVVSNDLHVHIRIRPRRSLDGEDTRLSLRAEPMPLLELEPERLPGAAPVAAWVWDGSSESAQQMLLHILELLRHYLRPEAAGGRGSRMWRLGVLGSLFPDSIPDSLQSEPMRV